MAANGVPQIRLTQQEAGECAVKSAAASLAAASLPCPTQSDPMSSVDSGTFDDTEIDRIAAALAIVQTTGPLTPLGDDRFTATKALSFSFPIVGNPITALPVNNFPQRANLAVLRAILHGGLSKMGYVGLLGPLTNAAVLVTNIGCARERCVNGTLILGLF
jgi:selenophosphate synthase